MRKILISLIVTLMVATSCVDENRAKRNLESTLVSFENALLRKKFAEAVGYIPEELLDAMIDQSPITITRDELKKQVEQGFHDVYNLDELDFKFLDIGKMVEHGGNVFFRIRTEVSGLKDL
jgi:hypothetical protein